MILNEAMLIIFSAVLQDVSDKKIYHESIQTHESKSKVHHNSDYIIAEETSIISVITFRNNNRCNKVKMRNVHIS